MEGVNLKLYSMYTTSISNIKILNHFLGLTQFVGSNDSQTPSKNALSRFYKVSFFSGKKNVIDIPFLSL